MINQKFSRRLKVPSCHLISLLLFKSLGFQIASLLVFRRNSLKKFIKETKIEKQINYLIRIRNTLKLAFPPHTECGERQTISVMTGGTLLKTVFNLTSQGQWAPTTVSGSG